MASYNLEASLGDAKLHRAEARNRDLVTKRRQFERARSAPRMRSVAAPAADRAKPHRSVRTAARALIARGAVEAQADIPALVSVGGRPAFAQSQKKPSAAHMMVGSPKDSAATGSDVDEGSDTETIASGVSDWSRHADFEAPREIGENPQLLEFVTASGVVTTIAADAQTSAEHEISGWEMLSSAECRSAGRGAIRGWNLLA